MPPEPITESVLRRKSSNTAIHGISIDMTPLVDLGFLLITFFVFTVNISEPGVLKLVLPKDAGINNPVKLPDRLALTILPAENDQLFYYHGDWNKAIRNGSIEETNYSVYGGIGEVIRNKQTLIAADKQYHGKENELMLLIKPSSGSTYKNLVDLLDEIIIHDVRKYAVVDISDQEIEWLKNRNVRD